MKQEVEALSQRISESLEIDRKLMRMGSFMISSSCKKLSRIEPAYSVNHAIVKNPEQGYSRFPQKLNLS